MNQIHHGTARVSTPNQERPISPPVSPIEQLVAPRRSRKLEQRQQNKEAQAQSRIPFGGDPSHNIRFKLPSSIYTGTAAPTSPSSATATSLSLRNDGTLSPLRQGNNSSILYGSSSMLATTSTIGGNLTVKVDRSKKLKAGSSKHRARILTVGPSDVTYAGQSFNEKAVSDVGNFSLSDVIGRNYTPSSAGLTVRVIQSMMNGAASSKEALEMIYEAPPLPLGTKPSDDSHTNNKSNGITVPTEEERKTMEKSLTYDYNPKTGEKMIYAMAQKSKNQFTKSPSKFDPFKWNPRSQAPEPVVTTENRLKMAMSKYSVDLGPSPSFDMRSEDSFTEGSRNDLQQPSRNGKWSLTDDPSCFRPTASYNDCIVDAVNTIGGDSTFGGSGIGGGTVGGSVGVPRVPRIIQDRMAMNKYTETKLQQSSDYALRKKMIDDALERMHVAPTTLNEQQVLLSNLNELAYQHRAASTKASLMYDGLLVDQDETTNGTTQTTAAKKSGGGSNRVLVVNLGEQMKLKNQRVYLNNVRTTIQNTLCICEPLQMDLQELWYMQSKKLKLNVVDDDQFLNEMPMPLSDFSSIFINSVLDTR
jgi:hypothetical protein|tara:strand:- start:383 stop:2140 length:1758 start_codon:yes stop_codon:yes gene_type:complete